MDLSHELESHAALGAVGATDRLAADATKARLRARVARGKRVANVSIAAGLAAVAAVVVAAGAWAVPHLVAEPAQVPAGPPQNSSPAPVPSLTPSPAPPQTSYVPTPIENLPQLGEPGYLADMVGAYRVRGKVECDDVPNVPMSLEGSPFPGYLPMIPTWIDGIRIYPADPSLVWIPVYAATDDAYYDHAQQYVSEFYSLNAEHTLFLIDETGGWWGFKVYFLARPHDHDQPGVFVSVQYDGSGCVGGGGRAFGGPMPLGVYSARQMTYLPGENRTTISDLGTIEIGSLAPEVNTSG